MQSGKDYHDKGFKLRGEAIKLRHEAVAISQRSKTKIKKLEKEIVQLCSRQESLHDKVITANNSCRVLKAVVQEHKSINRSLVQDDLTQVKKHDKEMKEMKSMIFEMTDEMKQKNKETRVLKFKCNKAEDIAAKRLEN